MTVCERFVALVGLLLAGATAAVAQETVTYYHTDGIGSVRVVTDAGGNLLQNRDYLPFGEPWPSTPPFERRGFAGMEKDAETTLNYVGARYYTSGSGRFTSVDPVLDVNSAVDDPQRWNRYSYVANRPLKFIDRDGRNPFLIIPIVYGLYELGSTAYDAYTTYRTIADPKSSANEKLLTTGLFLAGALPGVPGGAASVGREAIRHVDDVADAAAILSRTPTDRLIQHVTRDDLVGAAREVATGIQHGGQHLKEVREAARGLRGRINDLNQGLSNPRLTRQRRLELQRELGIASRHLDAAEEALRGRYLQHDFIP